MQWKCLHAHQSGIQSRHHRFGDQRWAWIFCVGTVPVELHPHAGDATKDFYPRELNISYWKILFSKDFYISGGALKIPANVQARKVSLQMCEPVVTRDEPSLRFLSKGGVTLWSVE